MAFASRLMGLAVLVAVGCAPPRSGNSNREGTCGDGLVSATEICDDGNEVDGDGCSADCTSDEQCGNGVVDEPFERCDDGNAVGGDGCSNDCQSDEGCGNGVIDPLNGETCDDGNLIGNDGCSANCQSNEACGNNITDPNEACDSGNQFTMTCDPDCTAATCGDGTRNAVRGEECDDSDLQSGDGCDNLCRVEQCGNGRKETNEVCDSGGQFTAACDPDCTLPVCGDGLRNAPAGEACDNGGTFTASCDPNCTLPVCGDGTRNSAANEECDDSNTTSGDGCDNLCRAEVCGNGRKESNEDCDDGNTSSSDDCVSCRTWRCGDSFVNTAREQCDDSNTTSGDGCSGACALEPRVYVVSSKGQLVNLPNDCSTTMDNAYTYDGMPFGFTWVDTTPFTPSAVRVELDFGIQCGGPQLVPLTINGAAAGDYTFDNPGGCVCQPAEQLLTLMLSPASVGSYLRNGQNTFLMGGFVTSTGLSFDPGLGGYARITVYP